MDPNSVIFELSSDDEEVAYGNNKDAPISCDDFDDVVFVSEVVGSPKIKNSKVFVKEGLTYDFGGDDDDCMVLDGDPDKLIQVENDPVGGDLEELFVVGEKGQVACRDYPHPRHLCAKYPFTSTPHEMHCNQCHCYVCDSLAPCLYWFTGHCDATETSEFWKDQRNYSKNCHQTAQLAPESPTFGVLAEPIQFNQVPVSTPLETNYASHGQVPWAASIRRAHSRGTNVGIPYISNRSKKRPEILIQCKKRADSLTQRKKPADIFRNRHTGRDLRANTFRPDLIQQHLQNTGDNFCPRNIRLQNTGDNICPRNIRHIVRSPLPMLNEDNRIYSRTYARPWPDIQQNVSSIHWNYMCSQPLGPPQPSTSSCFVNAVTSQAQLPPRAHLGGISSRAMSFQSTPQVLSQSTKGSSFANAVPSEPQVYGVPNSESIDSPFQDAVSLDEPSYLAGIDHLFGVSPNDWEYDSTLQP